MSTRTLAATLAPGLLLALASWAGEAAAQNVCRGGPHTGGGIITCTEGAGSSADILVNPGKLGINHATANVVAVGGSHSDSGDVELRMTAGSVVTTGTAGHGLYARHAGATGGAMVIGMSGGSVETRGSNAYAIWARRASGTGNVRIDVTGGSLSRKGGTGGVVLGAHGGTGNVTVNMTAGATLEATGAGVGGLIAVHSGTGDLAIGLTGGSIATTGIGIDAGRSNAATAGNVAVTVSHASSAVRTTGALGHGVSIVNIAGAAAITMRDGLVETTGAGALGLHADSYSDTESGPGTTSIVLEGGTIRTRGGIHTFSNVNYYSHGIRAQSSYTRGDVSVRMTGGAVETAGAGAYGMFVVKGGPAGAGSIEMTGGTITTAGDGASGAYVVYSSGLTGDSANTEGLSIDVAGAVSAEGLNTSVDGLITRGLLGVHEGWGSAAVRTRAAAEIAAPFAVGMEGRLTNDASAAGRIVVTHEGAVEARDVGVLAWTARSSGHTKGRGARTADDAARTAPMIHVTSSGDVTVGASVTDAFIRARITGADETLSTGEQAVLSEIVAGDSDGLTKALAALPASYDAAWKAEAQNLLRKRAASSAAPTGDGPLAQRAAEEILGLSRAGVRAMALSHTTRPSSPTGRPSSSTEIVDHVRAGDALSDAERAVLDAVLTKGAGSELETALTALTGAAYTPTWKSTVRRLAATYNAGDIQVDVTGGAIAAEGNGVEALYAVPHDSNGAIAVTVAEGARITGGANGIYVRGAGATEGVRSQSVTVNGRVRGGTGAGVHLVGGGTVTVGATGEVGATSGVGILGDGGGDLVATVSGTVTGDLRVDGGGDLTANVMSGGVVTGTIHDPQTSFTVGNGASIGRLLYASGGTVTVSGGGTLSGVEGAAVESTAGPLSVTVNDEGRVEGDLESGGTLTANVMSGGVVTGTIHDPQASFTVSGRIGRLLYTSGGTVTVARTGALTGVEDGGKTQALHSEAGDLDVTVAGQVAGDLRAPSGGTLKLAVREGGTVTGTVHDPAGPLTVAGRIGRLLYTNGATVMVAATGALTGVEVGGKTEALRSAAGDLDVSVAGRITGDLRAQGGGGLSASVSGTVDGDVRAEGGGALTLDLKEGGTVTGTVHDPVGLPTVAGRIGRLLYTSGATVTVARTGALTGVEVGGRREALRSEAGDLALSVAGTVTGDVRALGDGDLSATISGTLTGDVFGLGAGEHTVTVSNGGTVTGTVHLAASTVSVHGRAGRVRFDQGGTVTVGSTGRITGVEVEGRTEAIWNEAGDLVVGVAGGGRITGDVIGLGSRPARVTTGPGSRVEGGIDVAGAGSEVRADGTVEGNVRFRRGGTVTAGPDGKVEGRVSSDRGELVAVAEQKPDETEAEAVERAFPGELVEEGGTPTVQIRKEGEPARSVGAPDTMAALLDGAWDVGVEMTESGAFEVARKLAPRSRVYEALPSVVLGLNGLRGFRERTAAPRSAKGGWARVESFRGEWKADASASQKESGVGLKYRHRRHGVAVGWGGALGEEARIGASLHHRRGTAEVTEGGDVELYGTGAGVSGTWTREEDYLDVQATMTWYEADLGSSRRGALRKDLSGFGHALGVEAGRRMALEHLPAGMVLTPRAGLVHSRVSMDAFSDATGARVRVDDARSLKGRAGVDVETKPGGAAGSRVFASVEVEHEFSTDRKVRVSGTELKSEAEATWLRLGLNGVYAWEEGRCTVQGGVGYATSGGSHELGGGLSLNLRF